jgi:hypothetical protein
MSSSAIRDPLADHLITPQNSALNLIDHQPAQFATVRSMDPELLLEDSPPIDRTSINSWEDVNFVAAVHTTGLGPMKAVIDEVADLLPGKLVIDPSNPIAIAADGTVSRTLPDGQSAGEVVASWLPQGTRYAKAFGTLPAPLLSSGTNRKPTPAVLFYTTDDARAAAQVERLIRIAGFEPMAVDGGVRKSGRIEVGGDLHALGGLNGRLLEQDEAASLLRSSKQTGV